MKTHLTLLGLFALPLATLAQAPTLTAANTSPVAGQTSTFFKTPGFNPGGSGPAQSWDFSNLSYFTDDISIYDSCTGCPSGSTLVARNPSGGTHSSQKYYKGNTAAFSLVASSYTTYGPPGSGISYPTFNTAYSRQRDLLRYPMSFGNTFTNTWSALQKAYTITDHGLGGTDTVTADAWGTIKTPAGTFTALRVRVGFVEYDTTKYSSSGGGNPVKSRQGVSYMWYDGVHKEPVYKTESSTTFDGNTIAFGGYYGTTPSGVGALSGTPFSWSVAPNPATGNRIKLILEGKDNVVVSLRLIDLLGREVRNLPATPVSNNTLTLETTGLPAGTYILHLVANGQPQGVQCIAVAN